MELIDEILMDLVPYMDKVFLCPMTEEEVLNLENIYHRRFPDYYRYFLKRIGFRQDLVWEAFQIKKDFTDISEFISSDAYFQFGNNGGEDYWLLKFSEEYNRQIFEYDYYCDGEIKSMGMTFDALLKKSLAEVKKNYKNKVLNSDKRWCVEFSVNTSSVEFFQQELGKYLDIEILENPKALTTEDRKRKYKNGLIEIEGVEVVLKKASFSTGQSLYFSWVEPVEEMKSVALTDKLDAALEKCIFKHEKCQYGILSIDALNL